MIRDGGGVGVVKVTGKPHPAGSPAWHADRHRRENVATEYGLLA